MNLIKLKCCLHAHTNEEPYEWIFHNAKTFIAEAKKRHYDVIAFTCHDHFFYNREISDYCQQEDIILIPGIEKSIEKKHVLIINASSESQQIKSFQDLAIYKKNHPQSLIIAPHPYFPGTNCLNSALNKNIHLFDCIEISHFFHNYINFNRKALKLANRNNIPLIATPDSHMKNQLDNSYCIVNSEKKDIKSIIKALKKQQYSNFSKPLSTFGLIQIGIKMLIINLMTIKKNRKI